MAHMWLIYCSWPPFYPFAAHGPLFYPLLLVAPWVSVIAPKGATWLTLGNPGLDAFLVQYFWLLYFIILYRTNTKTFYVLFGILAVFAWVLAIWFTETLGKKMPDSTEDVLMFYNREKEFAICTSHICFNFLIIKTNVIYSFYF